MVHNIDIWGFASIKNCPPNGFKPETKTVMQKVRDVKTFVCVDNNPCKIVWNKYPVAGKRQFIAIDIFNGKLYKATFPLSDICIVPVVTLSDYLLVDISDLSQRDSQVTLLNDKGHVKSNLHLPTDEDLHSQIKFGYMEGKDVFVSVASAMGKEQIVASKIKNPN